MADLYYIENVGCDDTTKGLAIIPEEQFDMFKNIIEDLNKNSSYGCMPIIQVYKIDETMIRESTSEDYGYDTVHLGDSKYVIKDCFKYGSKLYEMKVI